MSRLAFLLFLPLLAAGGSVRAEIYQWTDANGRVHFGDSAAGAGKPAKAIEAPGVTSPSASGGSSTASDAERQERLNRLRAAYEADRQAREQEQERKQRRQDNMRADCQRLRDELATMDGRRVYVTGADGERQFLDDAQRKAYVDKAQQALQEHCP